MKKNLLIKNFASLGMLQIANYVFPLIAIPVISRIIGPVKFGVIGYAASFMNYFNLLIAFGFDYTATRRIAQNPDDINLRNKIFSEVFHAKVLLFITSLFLFLVCLYIVPPLAAESKVAIYSFIFCFSLLFTQTWLFQGMQDLPKIATLTFISRLLFTVIVLFVVRKESDYIWQPLINSIIQVIISVASMYWAYKLYNLKLFTVTFEEIWNLLGKEKMIFFSLVVISLYTTTNVVILGLFKSNEQVGYYTAAQKLIDVASAVINFPLAQTLFPFIGFAFGEGQDKGIALVRKVLPLIVFFTTLFALSLFLIGPTILVWFYGKQFEQSVPVFKILAFVPLIVSVNNVFCVQAMLNMKMDKSFFIVTAGGAVLGLSLNLLMVRYTGYIGTAWNWMIVEIFITLAAYVILRIKKIDLIDLNEFKWNNIYAQLQMSKRRLK